MEFLQQLCLSPSQGQYEPQSGFTYPEIKDKPLNSSFNGGSNTEVTKSPSAPQSSFPATYPLDYVARSNPVRDIIEATERDSYQNSHQSHSDRSSSTVTQSGLNTKPLFAGNVIVTTQGIESPRTFLQQLQHNKNVTTSLRSSYEVI